MKKIAGKWLEVASPLVGCRCFTWGYCRVLIEKHDPPYGWHLSISCAHRYPSWEEIKAARYDLLPSQVTMAMLLPPPSEYVNMHPNCFHLHEVPSDGTIVAP